MYYMRKLRGWKETKVQRLTESLQQRQGEIAWNLSIGAKECLHISLAKIHFVIFFRFELFKYLTSTAVCQWLMRQISADLMVACPWWISSEYTHHLSG